jgi:hypothetical protein
MIQLNDGKEDRYTDDGVTGVGKKIQFLRKWVSN